MNKLLRKDGNEPLFYQFFRKMKLTILIVTASILSCLSAETYSQTKKLTLVENNSTLLNVLRAIEDQSEFRFFYNEKVDVTRSVSVEADQKSVADVLDKVLANTSVKYKVIGRQIALYDKDEMEPTLTEQQDKKITGKVTDQSGVSIPGVSVVIKGTTTGVITDNNGNYSLSNISENAVIQFSFVGMRRQDQALKGRSVIDVTLQAEEVGLGEVVVTALGMSKEVKKLGYSVTEVRGSELETTKQINPVNSLMGKVAGVQIDQGASGPFGNSRILIRGNSTLSTNNQPIFVIDGVIVENDAVIGNDPSAPSTRDFQNDLSNLNSENFESVSVLKGSAAAALYGSRAINGVILITTKKGTKRDGIGVDFSQSFVMYHPYKGPDLQNQYGGGTVGAFFTDWRDPNYQPNQQWTTKVFPIDPQTGEPYIDPQPNREAENWGPKFAGQRVRNYDGTWTNYNAVPNNFLDAFRDGLLSSTNFAFSGATDKTSFRFSLTRDGQDGIVKTNSMKREGFNLRVTHQLAKWLTADISADYNTLENNNPQNLIRSDGFAGDNWGMAYTFTFPRNFDTKYWNRPEKYTSQKFGGIPNALNPLETNRVMRPEFWFNMNNTNASDENRNIRGRFSLNAKLTKWANLIVEANLNNNYLTFENKALGINPGFAGGSYTLRQDRKESNFMKWMLTFNNIKVIDDIKFNGFIGGEQQNSIRSFNQGQTSGGLMVPGSYFIANSVFTPLATGGTTYNKRINSVYASADLEYKNQLFLTATWRGDWSSALTYKNGSGNNFYNYPSASLSWIASETFELPQFISFAKLRTNLAELGKDTDPFKINPGYVFTGKAEGEAGTPTMASFSSSATNSPNLQPERKVAKEVGMEVRFLKNRVGFDLSLYQDNTYNQIISIPTPVVSGVSGININAGNIQNKGIELTLDGTPFQTANFQWSSRLTFSSNKNLIVELGGGQTEYNLGTNAAQVSSWAIVGKSYGTIRSDLQATRYNNPANANDPKNGMKVLNWRNDARVAFPQRSGKYQDVGDVNAKFRAGWSNDFTYKNWTLNVLVDGKFGGDMSLESYRAGMHTGLLASTLFGRDKENGGVGWTSKYDNITYDDGMIIDGVFAPGIQATQPNGTNVTIGGMTFKEAYAQGFVEPSHAPQFYYRYASYSTGTSDFYVVKSTWISLRQVALSYTLPKSIASKLKMGAITLSVIGRDLCYLYNSLPYHFNPASFNSNATSSIGEEGFLPMVRSIGGSVKVRF